MYQPLIKFHPHPAIITQVLRIVVSDINIEISLAIITQVLSIFATDRKQVDFGRGNGSFPVGSDSRKRAAKWAVLSPKNK